MLRVSVRGVALVQIHGDAVGQSIRASVSDQLV